MEEFSFAYNFLFFSFAFVALGFALECDIKKRMRLRSGQIFIAIFCIAFTVLFGLREIDIGTDTWLYYWQYSNYEDIELGTDFLMYFIFASLNYFSDDPSLFFILMSILYTGSLSIALVRYAKSIDGSPLLVVFSLVAFFFFQSMGINIIRQGVSLGFFVLGLSYFLAHSKTILKSQILIPFALSVGFHFTGLVPIIFFLIAVYFSKLKLWFYISLYSLSTVLAALSVSVLAFKDSFDFGSVDERRSSYLDVSDFTDEYSIGFKPQFVAFNTIFLVIFLLIRKYLITSKEYDYMLKYYILSSAFFYMAFQLPYSDRWGIMSWIILPFLIAPLFRNNGKRKFAILTLLFLIGVFVFFQIILADKA